MIAEIKNFTDFIGIDWSGANIKSAVSKPSKGNPALAVGHCQTGDGPPRLILPENGGAWTRQAIADFILAFSRELPERRVLIGIDCNFGYCHTVGVRQFGASYTSYDLWQAVEKAATETPPSDSQDFYAQDFYAGAYARHPVFGKAFWTKGPQPDWFIPEKLMRQTEKHCIAQSLGRPESPFKLIGAKQVGKGGLAGMRMVLFLKEQLGSDLCIWPFEKDTCGQARTVITEIFPRQFLVRAGFIQQKIHSAADFTDALYRLGVRPDTNQVSPLLSGLDFAQDRTISDKTDALCAAVGLRMLCGQKLHVPVDLFHPPAMTRAAQLCEGWIFGVA